MLLSFWLQNVRFWLVSDCQRLHFLRCEAVKLPWIVLVTLMYWRTSACNLSTKPFIEAAKSPTFELPHARNSGLRTTQKTPAIFWVTDKIHWLSMTSRNGFDHDPVLLPTGYGKLLCNAILPNLLRGAVSKLTRIVLSQISQLHFVCDCSLWGQLW